MDVQRLRKLKQLSKDWDFIREKLNILEGSNNDIESAMLAISNLIKSELTLLKEDHTKIKEKLIANGYEPRFCYVLGNLEFYQDDDSISLDSSDFKCLICHKSVPTIKGIRVQCKKDYTLTNNSLVAINIHIVCDQIIDKSFIIGHGENEKSAWDMAIENFCKGSIF